MTDTTTTTPDQTTTPGATSSLINTSALSRADYANNVTTMNAGNAALSTGGTTGTDKLPSPGTQKAVYDTQTGALKGYTQADGTFTDISGGNKDTSSDKTGPTSNDNNNSSVSSKVNPDGSTTTINKDGSSAILNSDGTSYTLPAGVDPSVGKQMNDNVQQATKDIEGYKTAVDNATILYNSDVDGTNPAAVAAANQIKASFDTLISQMKDKNAILMGRTNVAIARYGGLGQMNENFRSDQMDRGIQRIADLTTKAQNAILKSNEAYRLGDLKALNEATRTYEASKKEGQAELVNLQNTLNAAVKSNQEQAKIEAKAVNDQVTNDIKSATALAKNMADAIAKSGVTNQADIDTYIKTMADNNGISNPDVLKSALIKAQQDAKALDLKNENTESIIKKRGQTKTGKTNTYASFTNKPTASVITKVNAYLTSIGASQADIAKVNKDEVSFYKVYNKVPSTKKQGS